MLQVQFRPKSSKPLYFYLIPVLSAKVSVTRYPIEQLIGAVIVLRADL